MTAKMKLERQHFHALDRAEGELTRFAKLLYEVGLEPDAKNQLLDTAKALKEIYEIAKDSQIESKRSNELRKRKHTLAILRALVYGSASRAQIARDTGICNSSVRYELHRLRAEGLIEKRALNSASFGRTCQHFMLTAKGTEASKKDETA